MHKDFIKGFEQVEKNLLHSFSKQIDTRTIDVALADSVTNLILNQSQLTGMTKERQQAYVYISAKRKILNEFRRQKKYIE